MMAAMTAIHTANINNIMDEGNVENDETGDSKYDQFNVPYIAVFTREREM